MATYMGPMRSVFGPVGQVQVLFEYDDMGTPAADPPVDDDPNILDDEMINVHWRNPNPQPASMVVTFKTSGRQEVFILTENTPDWQPWPVPANLQARRGQLIISGPNYPATRLSSGRPNR